ncbi:MAG TPA: hypothetical protein VEK06_01010, partial [Myxococcota bacterium]|nr:hypothetical protein [Myxococcota bacterium]
MNDTKHENDAKERENTAKRTSAVDTGKRIDVGVAESKRTTLRRHKDRAQQPRPKRVPKEEIKLAPEKTPKEEPKPIKEEVKIEPPIFVPTHLETLEIDESGDFASMLAEAEAGPSTPSLKMGDKVTGKVVHVGEENSFIALGPKLEAAIATAEFKDESGEVKLKVGSNITAYVISVHGGVTLSTIVAQSGLDEAMLQEALAKRIPVLGKILSANKGGFDVAVSGKRAFCPIGQIDLRFVS